MLLIFLLAHLDSRCWLLPWMGATVIRWGLHRCKVCMYVLVWWECMQGMSPPETCLRNVFSTFAFNVPLNRKRLCRPYCISCFLRLLHSSPFVASISDQIILLSRQHVNRKAVPDQALSIPSSEQTEWLRKHATTCNKCWYEIVSQYMCVTVAIQIQL